MGSESILDKIKKAETITSSLEKKFNLLYNPFPKVGIANLNESDKTVLQLAPAYEYITNDIIEFIKDAISHGNQNPTDKYINLIIRGEYGSGKTQTLMYIKSLFNSLRGDAFKPYVVYLDNPGMKLSEMIGSIISQVGIENFRRYLWNEFAQYLNSPEDPSESLTGDTNHQRKDLLIKKIKDIHDGGQGQDLFGNQDIITNNDLWEKLTNISYKYLLDSLFKNIRKSTEQKEAVSLFKSYLTSFFLKRYSETPLVSEYFYDIVTENVNVTKSWYKMTSGNIQSIENKEFLLLKAIVEVVKKNMGASDFIILVDEFEEITIGRLKPVDLDNYLRNLRSLIDKEKNWCSVFAMNFQAMETIKKVSPPLASRIGDRIITLKPFDFAAFRTTVINYLDLARQEECDKKKTPYPFTEDGLNAFFEVGDQTLIGSPRFLLKKCFEILQRASEKLSEGEMIDSTFVKNYIN